MRITFVSAIFAFALASGAIAQGASTDPNSPAGRFLQELREKGDHDLAHRYDRYRPSDVADCRSRGNAAFGNIDVKEHVMNDCLEARRLRRQGR